MREAENVIACFRIWRVTYKNIWDHIFHPVWNIDTKVIRCELRKICHISPSHLSLSQPTRQHRPRPVIRHKQWTEHPIYRLIFKANSWSRWKICRWKIVWGSFHWCAVFGVWLTVDWLWDELLLPLLFVCFWACSCCSIICCNRMCFQLHQSHRCKCYSLTSSFHNTNS